LWLFKVLTLEHTWKQATEHFKIACSPSHTNLEPSHELKLNLIGRSDEAQSLKRNTRTNQGRRLLGKPHQQGELSIH